MSPAKTSLLAALFCMCASSVAFAQSATSLDFEILAGDDGRFPMLTDALGNAANYLPADGVVDFRVDTGVAYDNPLFCFDFSDQASAVTLRAVDANGHVVMDAIGLDSALDYDLASGSIGLSPSASVQCFFEGISSASPQFGPFGEVADNQRSTSGGGGLFTDSFVAFPELDIRYGNLQINSGDTLSFDGAAVSPGDVISYDLIIENTGNATADQVAFQEVFPAYQVVNDIPESYFPAALSEGIWDCVPSGNATCPAAEGLGNLRFKTLDLPVGSSLTFTVSRQVMTESVGTLQMFAGAINGPGNKAESAMAQVNLDVVGAPVQMEFVQQPTDTTVGQLIDPPVVVEVVDASGNRVTTDNSTAVTLQLYKDSVSAGTLNTKTVTNGVVSFDALDTSDYQAGTGYQIRAEHGVLEPTVDPRISNQFQLLSP